MNTFYKSYKHLADSYAMQQHKENRRFHLLVLKIACILLILTVIVVALIVLRYQNRNTVKWETTNRQRIVIPSIDIETIPQYSGSVYSVINDNKPFFSSEELSTQEVFELYSSLDELGRCGTAYANLCESLMPTEDREEIGMIKPSGWQTVKYPEIIEDSYLYNRCHLIAYSLAGENANELNLITGTRYFNVNGMLPFENIVRQYIEETDNHVLYRVTPLFYGEDLVARGVLMEAYSLEDSGKGICFNVFIYNIQPGITIDYVDGSSSQIY